MTQYYLKELKQNQAEKTAQAPWPEHTRLLLVEDNRVNQLVVNGLLKDLGLQADIAANGLEALECLNQSPDDAAYSLIFMDCQMPEMDGYETSRNIRAGKAGKAYVHIPIIAMTANAMQGDREKCLSAGMSDYLSKPINSKSIARKLSKWLWGVEHSGDDNEGGIHSRQNNTAEHKAQNETLAEDLPDWDKAAALKRVRGKAKRLIALIELFLEDMPQRLDELQQAIDSGNSEDARLIAHTIKGISANLGGLKLQHLATQMEAQAKADKTELSPQMPKLIKTCKQLTQLMEQYLSEND